MMYEPIITLHPGDDYEHKVIETRIKHAIRTPWKTWEYITTVGWTE